MLCTDAPRCPRNWHCLPDQCHSTVWVGECLAQTLPAADAMLAGVNEREATLSRVNHLFHRGAETRSLLPVKHQLLHCDAVAVSLCGGGVVVVEEEKRKNKKQENVEQK